MKWLAIAAAAVVVAVGVWVFMQFSGDDAAGTSTTTTPEASGSTSESPGVSTTSSTEPEAVVAAYEPRFESSDCAFTEPAERPVECGYLVVPQNRDAPEDGDVRLHVAIFSAATDAPAPDPVVYLEGGPGGEVLESIDLVFEDRFAPFLDQRHLILFDQRGTGYSEPGLSCQAYRDLTFELIDDDLTTEEYLAIETDVLEECRAQYLADGADLSQYNSAVSAADVADLRTALGIDEWNLYGISYGTRLGLTIMRDHPEGVRSVILDSVYPPEIDGVADIPTSARRAFDVLFAGCAADPECAAAFPDLEARFTRLVDRLDESPIEVPVVDLFSGAEYTALLRGTDLTATVFQGLYAETIIPTLPELIASVESGDYRDLGNLISAFLANGEFFSIGMHLSVQCNEEVPFADPERTAAALVNDPHMGEFIAGSVTQSTTAFEFCDSWASGTGDPIEAQPVTSDLPTLVLAGEYDPITPPFYGRDTSDRLSNATFHEFPGLGHAVSAAGPCPLSITLGFLDDPTAPTEASCIDSMPPPDFTMPGEFVEVGDLVPFEDEFAGVTGVVPEGWDSVGFGTHARQESGLDQTAIIQQAVPGGSASLLIGLLAGQLGVDGELEETGMVFAGGREWILYEGEIQGFSADIALSEDAGTTFLAILVADPSEREMLFDAVLVPVLEAMEPR